MKDDSHIQWEPLLPEHGAGVMKIFNEYVETTTAAFPPGTLPESFYKMILERVGDYPAYALVDISRENHVAGFCFLASYNPFSTFRAAANITCFIEKNYTGQGLGKKCLDKLEAAARLRGIAHLIADISSENGGSLRFHQRHGFKFAGKLENIGEKLNRLFSVVYMQKQL